MSHLLSIDQMKELEQNQEECKDLPPITYRATFKLSKIEELLKAITKSGKFAQEDEHTHNVCITFVREDWTRKNDDLGYKNGANPASIQEHITKKNNKEYTQVIPIITGCQSILDPKTRNCKSFEYMKFDEKIPYVRSGGEGTGLIPPPPPPGND